ncbi:hypothetical protein Chor_010162 [Crotalus horridus]
MAPVGKHRDSPSFNKNGGKEKAPAGLIRKQPRRWDRGSLKEGMNLTAGRAKGEKTLWSNVNQRKCKAKTSNQKAKEDYEKIKIEREKKKEAAKKRREEREQAQKLYKQKKMETYKILSKRTRKGQPNLNLQMEYLLQKIEQKA